MGEAVVDIPRLVAISVAVDPGLDRIPVCRGSWTCS